MDRGQAYPTREFNLADSIRAHFAVGYFFLSGFQAIAEHILQETNL